MHHMTLAEPQVLAKKDLLINLTLQLIEIIKVLGSGIVLFLALSFFDILSQKPCLLINKRCWKP